MRVAGLKLAQQAKGLVHAEHSSMTKKKKTFVLRMLSQGSDSPRDMAGYLEQARQLVVDKGLKAHVRFLGRLSGQEMASCMAGAAVHVMPLVDCAGDVEGFGMVAVEAASYGTPTVAFDCGGVGEAVGDPACLIEPGDYPALERRITELMEGSIDSQSYVEWASNFYPERYAIDLRAVV